MGSQIDFSLFFLSDAPRVVVDYRSLNQAPYSTYIPQYDWDFENLTIPGESYRVDLTTHWEMAMTQTR